MTRILTQGEAKQMLDSGRADGTLHQGEHLKMLSIPITDVRGALDMQIGGADLVAELGDMVIRLADQRLHLRLDRLQEIADVAVATQTQQYRE